MNSISDNTTSLAVIAVSEDNSEQIVVSSGGTSATMWHRLYAVLPDGVHQIIVEGRRSNSGFSSLSVDDVAVRQCSAFGE